MNFLRELTLETDCLTVLKTCIALDGLVLLTCWYVLYWMALSDISVGRALPVLSFSCSLFLSFSLMLYQKGVQSFLFAVLHVDLFLLFCFVLLLLCVMYVLCAVLTLSLLSTGERSSLCPD